MNNFVLLRLETSKIGTTVYLLLLPAVLEVFLFVFQIFVYFCGSKAEGKTIGAMCAMSFSFGFSC